MTPGPDEPRDDNPHSAPENSGGSTRTLSEDDEIRASRDENLTGFNDSDVMRIRNYDPVAIAMAGSFGAFIPGAVEAANATLVRTTELHGEFSISNGGGTMEDYFREAFDVPDDREKEDDDNDGWQEYADAQEDRRREREEWAQTEHSFAGVEMTGEEWGQLADDISPNGKLHKKLVQWYVDNGRTPAEAEQKAADDEAIYRIEAKPQSERTPEEQARIDQANTDPEFHAATSFLNQQRDQGVTQGNELEAGTTVATQNASTSARIDAYDIDVPTKRPVQSVTATASALGSGTDFPNAPNLTEHHQAAVAATVPLDRPKPSLTVVATTPAPGGGFDV